MNEGSDDEVAPVDIGEDTTEPSLRENMSDIAANIDYVDFLGMMPSQLPALNRQMLSMDYDSKSDSSHSDLPDIASVDDGQDDTANILIEDLPESATNIDVVDSAIAQQMMKLSVEEREKAYMDLHGVKIGPVETEEAIDAGLDALKDEINRLQDKDAFNLAWSMNPEYVENRSFRLAFLRAESFDAKKAALRFVRFFQLKLDLFGEGKLVMEIVQDDLDREAMEAMYCGRGQWLDVKDRAGRHVIVTFFDDQFSTRALLQRAYYNAMTGIRTEDAQIHGFVAIIYALAPRLSAQRDVVKHFNITKFGDGLPARVEAIHFCHCDQIAQELFAVSKAALGSFIKTRTRTHHGTHDEIMSSLTGFGIVPGTIPVAEGCKITNLEAYHQQLVDLRTAERRTQPKRHKISVPFNVDVLFGKGTPCQIHQGNVQLRRLVSHRYKMYDKAVQRGQKNKIAQETVHTVQQNAGMFLRPDGDSWVCVEDKVARQKVSALFRSFRPRVGEK